MHRFCRAVGLVAAALCAASASTYGQLTLLQGETYTYEFNSFIFQTVHPITVIPGRPTYYGQFAVYFDASTFPTFESGDLLRYEMFENSLAEIPICTDTLSLPFPPISPRCEVAEAWADQQGAIRLTMVSGSVTVSLLNLSAATRWDAENALYLNTIFAPVPEPATLTMLVCAALAHGLWRLARNKRVMPPNDCAGVTAAPLLRFSVVGLRRALHRFCQRL